MAYAQCLGSLFLCAKDQRSSSWIAVYFYNAHTHAPFCGLNSENKQKFLAQHKRLTMLTLTNTHIGPKLRHSHTQCLSFVGNLFAVGYLQFNTNVWIANFSPIFVDARTKIPSDYIRGILAVKAIFGIVGQRNNSAELITNTGPGNCFEITIKLASPKKQQKVQQQLNNHCGPKLWPLQSKGFSSLAYLPLIFFFFWLPSFGLLIMHAKLLVDTFIYIFIPVV